MRKVGYSYEIFSLLANAENYKTARVEVLDICLDFLDQKKVCFNRLDQISVLVNFLDHILVYFDFFGQFLVCFDSLDSPKKCWTFLTQFTYVSIFSTSLICFGFLDQKWVYFDCLNFFDKRKKKLSGYCRLWLLRKTVQKFFWVLIEFFVNTFLVQSICGNGFLKTSKNTAEPIYRLFSTYVSTVLDYISNLFDLSFKCA